jgi:hypothetical protein
MTIFQKSDRRRLDDTIDYLTKNIAKTGYQLSDLQVLKAKTQWSSFLSLGHRSDWGKDVSLQDRRLFANTAESEKRSALRALLLTYLYRGLPTAQVDSLKTEILRWTAGQMSLKDLYLNQIKWLNANHTTGDVLYKKRAADLAKLAVDNGWTGDPTFNLFGETGKCPNTCYTAALYFSFLGGVFSHRTYQDANRDRSFNVPDKLKQYLQIRVSDDNNLWKNPRSLEPGTLVMIWHQKSVVYNHMVMAVTKDNPPMYISVHTSMKGGDALTRIEKNFPEDYKRRSVDGAWLMSHDALIEAGGFNYPNIADRFYHMYPANSPKWMQKPQYAR